MNWWTRQSGTEPEGKRSKQNWSPIINHTATFFFFLSPVFQEGLGWNYTWMVEGGSTAIEDMAFLFNALYIKPLWNDLQKILPIQIEEEKKQERISMSAR